MVPLIFLPILSENYLTFFLRLTIKILPKQLSFITFLLMILLCLVVQYAAVLLGEDLAGGALYLLCCYGAVAGEFVGEVAVWADELSCNSIIEKSNINE